MTLDDP
ncbi:hypothetical protein E2C01_095402 [Portunus trituberculatus]|nr:hypothetical protein [Portunus trituberculatus]